MKVEQKAIVPEWIPQLVRNEQASTYTKIARIA